jgi:hypothetical protein
MGTVSVLPAAMRKTSVAEDSLTFFFVPAQVAVSGLTVSIGPMYKSFLSS